MLVCRMHFSVVQGVLFSENNHFANVCRAYSQSTRENSAYKCLIHFRENAIKPYIPRLWRNFLDFLALKSKAGKFWAKPQMFSL
jgi:hypothetical protein